MRNRITLILSVLGVSLASALLLTACGGGSGDDTSTPSDTAATQTTAPGPPDSTTTGAASDPLAANSARLSKAGFKPHRVSPGDATASIEAGLVSISYYKDPNQAAVVGEQIEKIFNQHPGNGLVEVHGNLVYFVGEEHPLSEAENTQFEQVVSASEGG